MNIKIQNLVTNPKFLFWIIVISTIIVILWASVVFKNRHTTSKDELKRDTHAILMMTITTLFITGFHYWSMGQQGLQTIFVNPYTAVKAANLTPKPIEITSTKELNSLTDKQKEDTIVIVFKFGCIDCQRLWLYAQENKELLPSKNILWISNKDANKRESDLVASSTRYPSIHYWKKIDSKLVKKIIQEPTDMELEKLSTLAKEYTK